MSLNHNHKPIHFRNSESKRVRRPRALLKSQQRMSETIYQSQSKMADPKENIEYYEDELDIE